MLAGPFKQTEVGGGHEDTASHYSQINFMMQAQAYLKGSPLLSWQFSMSLISCWPWNMLCHNGTLNVGKNMTKNDQKIGEGFHETDIFGK